MAYICHGTSIAALKTSSYSPFSFEITSEVQVTGFCIWNCADRKFEKKMNKTARTRDLFMNIDLYIIVSNKYTK
jgi:hypothetical protein